MVARPLTAMGMDIGATNARVALVDDKGHLTERSQFVLDPSPDAPPLADVTAAAVKLALDAGPAAVGIGTAGQIDQLTGTFLPGVRPDSSRVGFPLRRHFEETLGLPTVVDIDSKAAAYGELQVGRGRGMKNFVCITLGTGLGAGIVAGGRLVHGRNGFAGHAGHISIDGDGPLCTCGNHGCLELYFSGTAIGRRASERFGRRVTSEEAFGAASGGDAAFLEVIHAAARDLGRGLAIVGHLLNPEAFIFSGSMVEWHPLFFADMLEAYRDSTMACFRDMPMLIAELGEDAGLIGAGLLAIDFVRERSGAGP
jgi:glucokinase